MNIKNFALIGGLAMISLGLISFIPSLNVTEGLPPIYINMSYGMFLDLFPMNVFNKVALIAFGTGGIVAFFAAKDDLFYSINFSKIIFWTMGALSILGLFPQTNTLFGYWPLFGFEIIVHGIFSLIGGYYGYIADKDRTIQTTHRMHKI